MKRLIFITLLLLLNVLAAIGQNSTYKLTINSPGKVDDAVLCWGQSVIRGYFRQDINYGQSTELSANAWTWDGVFGKQRGLLRFNLDQLPLGAEIVSAKLSLYHNEYYASVNEYQPMSNLNGSNAVYLKRVTTDWSDSVVTWNTQPSTTDQNQVTLPQSSSRIQDYTDIDVTALVNDILVSGKNYGFMLQLITEEYYRSMIFYSSEYEDTTVRPKLVVEYKISDNKQSNNFNIHKISATQGGFTGKLDVGDQFATTEAIGDIDGDGVEDLAVGAFRDDDGGTNRGAVWILFMNTNGSVKSTHKISDLEGNLTGTLRDGDLFGESITKLGDLNKDGVPDIVVGAPYDSDDQNGSGAVWVLFLNSDGTVKAQQKISANQGGITGVSVNDIFGWSVTSIGDFNGDGNNDIAVGSPTFDSDGGFRRGCVWMLFLNEDGTVKEQHRINDYVGGLGKVLDDEDKFGQTVENVGDIDKDGVTDLAVGAAFDDDGTTDAGAVYILFLNADCTVKNYQKISDTQGNFIGTFNTDDEFGSAITGLGDIDGDGIVDIAVNSKYSDDGGPERGKFWILNLNVDGTVKDFQEFSSLFSPMTGLVDDYDYFGFTVTSFEGYTSNGKKQLAVGVWGDDDGYTDAGAVYIIDLDVKQNELALNVLKISATQGGFTGQLDIGDGFALGAPTGDINGDGNPDIVIGAALDDDGGIDKGAVWVLFLNADRSVKGFQKISDTEGGFTGVLNDDRFGCGVTSIGDLNKDGVEDIAVGAYYDDDIGVNSGAVWILFLNNDGTVKSHQKISATQGGLVGLTSNRFFGTSICPLGDLDGDGTIDIAIGAPSYDNDGGLYRGSIWVLFLNPNGTVKSKQIISQTQGGFNLTLDDDDRFGRVVSNVGDINGDGITDIAASAEGDDDGASNAGALYILFLNTDGTVKGKQKISATQGNFTGTIASGDDFGISSAGIGDLNGDGFNDIAVGSPYSDITGFNQGKVFILYLGADAKVKGYEEITANFSAFNGKIENGDMFGSSLSSGKGNTNSGKKELIIGASGDDDGATDAGAVYILNLDVDVKFKPIAEAGKNQLVCSNERIVITGYKSSVLDNDPLSFHWECPTYQLQNKDASAFTFLTPDVTEKTSYNFILTATCQGIQSDPDTITITVNPRPVKPTIIELDGTVISGLASHYQWYLNDSIIEGATEKVYIPDEDGNYSVVATNELGCSSENSEGKYIQAMPIAVITGVRTACAGSTIYLSGSSSYVKNVSNPGLTYQWGFSDNTIPNVTLKETFIIAPIVAVPTQVNCILQVFRGSLASTPETLSVTINPAPQTPIIKQFGDTLLAPTAYGYQWYREGATIAGQYDSTLVITKSGNYQVKLISDLGCISDISVPLNIISSGIDNLNYSIKVFPNPTTGVITISGLSDNERKPVTVIDPTGKVCVRTFSKNGTAQLDLSGLVRGQYLIVVGDQDKQSIKILKQ